MMTIPQQFIGMNALTIKQPYASLIGAGIKRIETRSWRTNYRGDLLIHSARTPNPHAIHKASAKFGIDDMPIGAVLCIARVDDCIHQSRVDWTRYDEKTEREWGYWSVGHYAWLLSNIRPVDPFVVKGALKIWTLK